MSEKTDTKGEKPPPKKQPITYSINVQNGMPSEEPRLQLSIYGGTDVVKMRSLAKKIHDLIHTEIPNMDPE